MLLFVFFNDTATTEIYTLSLHDALPILGSTRTIRTSCGVARSRIDESIAFTQPDLPAPVVPATSRCGILARSAPIARPATSLPSQTVSGDQSAGGSP